MSQGSLFSLLLVMVVAAGAPIISRLVPGRPPQVLFLILGFNNYQELTKLPAWQRA